VWFSARSNHAGLAIGIALVALLVSAQPLQAQQDNPIVPTRETDTIKPQPVFTQPGPVPVVLSAPVYEMLGPVVRARGGLLLLKGPLRIAASEGEYNLDTEQGKLRNVSFTTCTASNPDYHLTAGEATLLPNHKIKVTNVALYLGRTRVLMLPWMKLRIGGRSGTANIFPRAGYDSRDGVTLSQTFRLTDTDQSRTNLDLTMTTLHALEGAMHTRYGVGGKLIDRPGRYLTYGSMRARALDFPQPPIGDGDPQLLRPTDAARLQPFGTFTIRQRTYDAKSLGLVVYRQPELGASYVGGQLSLSNGRLDPRIELYPQITTSVGRYKEVPGHEQYLGRYEVAAQGSVNAVWLGPSTSIQPLGMITYSSYGDGQAFKTYGAGIDIAHISKNGSFFAGRYLARSSSGSTPFQFDNIDIAKEIDLACQVYLGKKVAGVGLTFDADNGTLFDWAIIVGQRSDCLATYFRWDNRYRRFSVDITLINM